MAAPEPPFGRKAAAALVVRTIDAIDSSGDRDRDTLLSDLLSVAWGSLRAQNQ